VLVKSALFQPLQFSSLSLVFVSSARVLMVSSVFVACPKRSLFCDMHVTLKVSVISLVPRRSPTDHTLCRNLMTSPNESPEMPFGDVTFRAKWSEWEESAWVLG